MRRVALLVPPLLVVAATVAHAQFYRYVDERGVPHYVEGLHAVPERYRAAAVPLSLRNSPVPPSSPSGAAATRAATVIRYTPGQPIVIDARINGSASARLLLDTGADRTLISPRALAAAGVSLTRVIAQGQMTGVTGSDRVQYVLLESLEVGQARVTRLPVAAYEMPQAQTDGLLGRDFLDQFSVNIDAARGEVTLQPR
ncbi:MAG: aspartyl protease family protein [Candidatus Rokubacteria bacterium]|nr:aspartyl protease family protein [Candidatus Rokubacteria bacterium]